MSWIDFHSCLLNIFNHFLSLKQYLGFWNLIKNLCCLSRDLQVSQRQYRRASLWTIARWLGWKQQTASFLGQISPLDKPKYPDLPGVKHFTPNVFHHHSLPPMPARSVVFPSSPWVQPVAPSPRWSSLHQGKGPSKQYHRSCWWGTLCPTFSSLLSLKQAQCSGFSTSSLSSH